MIINDVNTILMMKTSPLPTGYTLLNWICNVNTTPGTINAYINTNYYPTHNTRLKARFDTIGKLYINNTQQAGNRMIGVQNYFRFGSSYQNSTIWQWGNHTGSGGDYRPSYTWANDNRLYEFEIDANKNNWTVTINGNTETHTFTAKTFTAPVPLYLFGIDMYNGTAADQYTNKLYWAKLYENDVLVRDFYPAMRDADTVVGLYDIVNDVFYTNVGSGTFTYG